MRRPSASWGNWEGVTSTQRSSTMLSPPFPSAHSDFRSVHHRPVKVRCGAGGLVAQERRPLVRTRRRYATHGATRDQTDSLRHHRAVLGHAGKANTVPGMEEDGHVIVNSDRCHPSWRPTRFASLRVSTNTLTASWRQRAPMP